MITQSIVFQNAFLIDGNEGEPCPQATVVVENGTIREVGRGNQGTGSRKVRVIDLKGKTLMPGLIDAHVHPAAFDLSQDRIAALSPAVFVTRTSRNLELDLDLGFTSLRDAGGLDAGFRDAIDQNLIKGPRLFLSISPLEQSGGHYNQVGSTPAKTRPYHSIGIFPEVCDGPSQVRRAARRTLGRGADQIKVFADGEVLPHAPSDRARPGQWKFTVEELRAAAETAGAAGTYVMAHAYGPRAIQNCVEAGVRCIEHGNLMNAETADMMVQKGVFYVPTLTAYDVLSKEGRGGLDVFTIEKLESVLDHGHRALELAYSAGLKIGSGSDIVGPWQYLKGREFVLKGEVMSPMDTIVSATRTNAELLGMAEQLGTVEPGKLADLIVVDGNPLKDLALFERGHKSIVLVMKQGRILKNTMEAA
jgi:imidazolonepropionase-like amidohydrolase